MVTSHAYTLSKWCRSKARALVADGTQLRRNLKEGMQKHEPVDLSLYISIRESKGSNTPGLPCSDRGREVDQSSTPEASSVLFSAG